MTKRNYEAPTMETFINKDNWPTELAEAKVFAMQAVDTFAFKDKIPAFKRDIEKATSVNKLQFMIVNAAMSGSGLSVLR